MNEFTTRPCKELDLDEYRQLTANKEVHISVHALDHLSSHQRNLFKEDELIKPLKQEPPRKVYLQENGRYAAFFRHKSGFRKIIIEVEVTRVTVVSFMDTAEIPKYNL